MRKYFCDKCSIELLDFDISKAYVIRKFSESMYVSGDFLCLCRQCLNGLSEYLPEGEARENILK